MKGQCCIVRPDAPARARSSRWPAQPHPVKLRRQHRDHEGDHRPQPLTCDDLSFAQISGSGHAEHLAWAGSHEVPSFLHPAFTRAALLLHRRMPTLRWCGRERPQGSGAFAGSQRTLGLVLAPAAQMQASPRPAGLFAASASRACTGACWNYQSQERRLCHRPKDPGTGTDATSVQIMA